MGALVTFPYFPHHAPTSLLQIPANPSTLPIASEHSQSRYALSVGIELTDMR